MVFKILYEIGDSTVWEVSAPYVDISLEYLDRALELIPGTCTTDIVAHCCPFLGTASIVFIRIAGSQPEDKIWRFGQTLAVISSIVPLWGMYERIFGIVILRDHILEVKLTTIKDTRIRGLHHTILLISASNRAISPAFSHPEVFGTQWFRRIVVLIFGMTLIPTIYYVFILTYIYHIDDQSLLVGLLLPLTIYFCWRFFIFVIVTFVFILESAN